MHTLPRLRFAPLLIVRYLLDPLGCLRPFARKYGDTFVVPGDPPLVMTGDPEVIRAIYTADPDTFEPLNQDLRVLLGDSSLILIGGPPHRRLRRLLGPPFLGPRMRAHGPRMVELTEEATAAWRPGDHVPMLETAQQISLDVILSVVFGLGRREAMAEMSALLLDTLQNISPLVVMAPCLRREFGGFGPWAAFQRRRARLLAAFDTLIAEARGGGRQDVLGLLLSEGVDGERLSDAEVRDQLLLLVVAGHETTAITLAWAMYALHRPENEAALHRLRDELAQVGPSPDALAAAPYLEAVVQETLRRYPVAPAVSPRRVLKPLSLPGGVTLPPGVGVVAAQGLAQLREATFPEPLRFRPERFLERSHTPFETVPFGGGARRCLGASMAMHELKLVLGTLLRRFRFEQTTDREDRGKVRAANVGPATSVVLRVVERSA
jgi:cytochrome P450